MVLSPTPPVSPSAPPFFVSLSLDRLAGPLLPQGPRALVDPFDALDQNRTNIIVQLNGLTSPSSPRPETEGQSSSRGNEQALGDRTAVLFPSLSLDPRASGDDGDNEDLPGWLKETSGRVTALGAARIQLPLASSSTSLVPGSSRTHTRLRVVAGCEDGSVWLLSSPESTRVPVSTPTPSHPSPPLSTPSHYFPTIPNLAPSSTASSSSQSLLLETIIPPRLSSHSSSPPTSPRPSSSSSRPSKPNPSIPSPRISSSTPSLRRVSSTTSLATLSNQDSASNRNRKASATVSITPSASPNPSQPILTIVPPPSVNFVKGHHRKAKDSITTGIGLWEIESHTSTSMFDGPFSPPLGGMGKEEEGEEEEEELGGLEPVLKVLVRGRGEVVVVRIVEGLRAARCEGGKSFVTLRRSGQLGVHSLVDGRVFGTHDLGLDVSSADRTGVVQFDGLEILHLADCIVAICFGRNGVGLITLDLDSLQVLGSVPGGTPLVRLTSIFKQGEHYLVYPTSSPSTDDSPPTSQLVVRPVVQESRIASTTEDEKSGASHSSRVQIAGSANAGVLEYLGKDVKGVRNCADDLLAFDSSWGLLLFTIRDQKVSTLGHLELGGIVDVCVQGYNNILVATRTEVRVYRLDPSSTNDGQLFSFILLGNSESLGIESGQLLPLPPSSNSAASYIVARSVDGSRLVETVTIVNPATPHDSHTLEKKVLYQTTPGAPVRSMVTCSAQVDRMQVVLGYSSGAITLTPYAGFDIVPTSPNAQMSSAVTVLSIIDLAGKQVLVAGAVDGSAAAWSLTDWTLIGEWFLFASPVSHLISLPTAPKPHFSDLMIFISANSPIAFVSLSPPRLLFVLPGTNSDVESLSMSGDEILVVYSAGLARAWSLEGELRRSMDLKTAMGVLGEGTWTTCFTLAVSRASVEVLPTSPILSIDLRHELELATLPVPSIESRKSKSKSSNGSEEMQPMKNDLSLVRFLLSHLIAWGLDTTCDQILLEHLGVERPAVVLGCGVDSETSMCIPVVAKSVRAWCVSPEATAQRVLRIVCLLKVFLDFPDTERLASQAILFYASSLADSVGDQFAAPALDVLANYWLDTSNELQQAARLLFGSYLNAASASEVDSLVNAWVDLLPSRQLHDPKSTTAQQAVLVLGLVASANFTLLSTAVLKDLSTSIFSFFSPDSSPYAQCIATELCSLGFEIWQNYIDAMELLRLLFDRATGLQASTRSLARTAVLHVAGVNTPLFMTTLLFDILNPSDVVHRNATMKLLGFMVRKKPLVLYTSLPRLAEAVVKSLDPTVTSLRESIQQAATVILSELVRTYPSIAFHSASQRLAVGTHEGAAIVYDLRTATRLYVLEGHFRAVTALSWSPDGRRLVSVSLEESKAVVWKVGVGILSMFTPGVAPRQGSGGTAKPFKTIDFNVGDESLMTTAATLEWVAFEWPAERTTRLRIRETALTFSV